MDTNSAYGHIKSSPAKLLAMMIAMALMVAGSFSAFTAPANAAGNQNKNTVENVNELLDYINEFRADKGLEPVKISTDISNISLDWSDYMAETGIFNHNPDYSTDPRANQSWSAAAENIAMNGGGSIAGLHQQWVDSPGHNAIMSKPEFNVIGIGLVEDRNGYLYGTVNFFFYRHLESVPNVYDSFPDPNNMPVDPEPTTPVDPKPTTPVTPEPTKPADPKPTTPVTPEPTKPVDPKPTTPAKPKQTFTDVPKKMVFNSEIEELAELGVTTGWYMKDGTQQFRPLQNVKRDAMIVFIYRAMGSPAYTPPKKSPFTDVKTNNIFYKEIAWAYDNGIAEGWKMKDGTRQFRPLQNVKRDAVAAFLMRASGDKAPKAKQSFADVKTNQHHAAAMTWMRDTGISKGWANGSKQPNYRPLTNTKRDAMAAFMVRWMDYTGYNGS